MPKRRSHASLSLLRRFMELHEAGAQHQAQMENLRDQISLLQSVVISTVAEVESLLIHVQYGGMIRFSTKLKSEEIKEAIRAVAEPFQATIAEADEYCSD